MVKARKPKSGGTKAAVSRDEICEMSKAFPMLVDGLLQLAQIVKAQRDEIEALKATQADLAIGLLGLGRSHLALQNRCQALQAYLRVTGRVDVGELGQFERLLELAARLEAPVQAS